MHRLDLAFRSLATAAALALAMVGTSACGGGGSADGNPTGSMALVSFQQAGVNNAALNQVLEFRFSEAVDPQSLNPASLQVREGPAFGVTVEGAFRISGSKVFFEPKLPGLCDLTDAGFKANTQYRVTLVGFPEQFALRRDDGNPITAVGDPLKGTLNFEFHTRAVDDPLLFTDQIAATSPVVTSTTPADATACVKVEQGNNKVVINISENLRPCSISSNTVLIDEYQRGDPLQLAVVDPLSGRISGFTPVADNDPGDKFSWGLLNGGESAVSPPQRVRCKIALVQNFATTQITLTPEFGQFPENALIVVQLTFGIQDFGGASLVPFVFAFTTENLPEQTGQYIVKFEGETPILKDQSTADVNTVRSPLVAQGWLLFSGDADNGGNLLQPTAPENNPPACNNPRQVNDGVKDDFDPSTDVVLDTGLTINTCVNKTDGSTAVVWEFRTLRLRSGRTLRITGVNPAIILVQGDVVIETGAVLRVRGDAVGGTPQGTGAPGTTAVNSSPAGGVGVAGAGNGGKADALYAASNIGESGRSGVGSPSGQGTAGGLGGGVGGSNGTHASFTAAGAGYGGGGGGHSQLGMDGASGMNAIAVYKSATLPTGGLTYPAMDNKLLTPSAGSGGGGGGYGAYVSTQSFAGYDGSGGAGGAGGGFLDLTSSGNISIFGVIDAAGGRGGNAAAGFYMAGGGGGGGSGGGVRLLTPFNITVTGGTITTAGGQAGSGATTTGGTGPANAGGAGGKGRLVMEDGDSLITGLGGATLVPAEGDPDNGFYRGIFDASRFKGGGLEPQVVTDIFQVGPSNPNFTIPVVQADFVASIPTGADRGLNATSCLIEARGYQMLPDGTVDLVGGPTVYRTIGYLRHSGVASAPFWVGNANPGDVTIPPGNGGPGISALSSREFLQLRITFFLPNTMGPFDPGPILDDWTIRFKFDQ